MGLSLMNMLRLCQVYVSHYSMLLKIFLRALLTSPVSVLGFTEHIVPILFMYIMLQRQLSHLNARKLDRRQVQASYTRISVSGFTLSYTANMFTLIILYDFCLSSAQFCYIPVYIRGNEVA
jgi:hypothetical protein